jgi:hypothetical protein
MKNTYRVILIGLAVLGVVYASTGPEKKSEEEKCEPIEQCSKSSTEPEMKTEKPCKYKPIDLCKFPVSMKVGHYVQIKECYKREIKLVQVDCKNIGRDGGDFPCYKGSDVIEVRANFPAIFTASISKNEGNEDMLKNVNLYWENGVNTIQGGVGWEELTLCLEVWGAELYKYAVVGTIEVGEITIEVSPPDETQSDETQ